MSYSYLDGSQTGGILQNLAAPQQSYIPSISPTQQQQYTPGYGTAPYADPQQQNTPFNPTEAQVAGMVSSGGAISREDAMRKLLAQHQQGTMSSYPGGNVAGGTTPQTAPGATGGGGLTVAGQDAWMTPEQMRAQTNALQASNFGGKSSGGAGGGSAGSSSGGGTSGTSSSSGLGGLLGAAGGAISPSGSPGSFSQLSVPQGGGMTYMAPGQQPGQPGQPGQLQMQQASPQNAMNQYQNSLGYQMMGNDQTNQFQHSPGYQYAVNEAMNQVGQNASAHGLLESGSALRAMTDRAQGMAQQDYGNWWNRQNQLYNDYQNRLQGLAGGSTGSQEAMQLGQTMGAGTMQTGSNVGSLFGNQGSSGMGGIINTGAAQSGNITNAGAQQAQVNQANQSTQLAGATLSGGLF